MRRYFLHLRHPSGDATDCEGVVMSEASVGRAALLAARDCMAADLHSGHIDLTYRIDVQNEKDEIIHTLHFADAVRIIPAAASELRPDP